MQSNTSQNSRTCNVVINQFDTGTCWFVSMLHALFFSDRIRTILTPSMQTFANKKDTHEIAQLILNVYNYHKVAVTKESQHQVCFNITQFLTYIIFKYGYEVYTRPETSKFDAIAYNVMKTILHKGFERINTEYNNYIVRCNPTRGYFVKQSRGGLAQDFITPFMYSILDQKDVLYFDITYLDDAENAHDPVPKRISNQTYFDDVVNTILASIPDDEVPTFLLIGCSLSDKVSMENELTKSIKVTETNAKPKSLFADQPLRGRTNTRDIKYTLESAIFGITIEETGHAIAGIKCGGDPYLVDSATTESKDVNWISERASAVQGYINRNQNLFHSPNTKISMHYGVDPYDSDLYIYVRSDQQKGGKKMSSTTKKLQTFLQRSLKKKPTTSTNTKRKSSSKKTKEKK